MEKCNLTLTPLREFSSWFDFVTDNTQVISWDVDQERYFYMRLGWWHGDMVSGSAKIVHNIWRIFHKEEFFQTQMKVYIKKQLYSYHARIGCNKPLSYFFIKAEDGGTCWWVGARMGFSCPDNACLYHSQAPCPPFCKHPRIDLFATMIKLSVVLATPSAR